MSDVMPTPLSPNIKVLDLTDEKGMLCGKFLAQMGAEVIKIEKPCGDAARGIPPFVDNKPGIENSLFYASYNTNKKSITLDIETADGQEIFKRLVKDADFVIESYTPGYLESLGLGYEDLEKINPRVILTSITPYGQHGPWSKFKASDLTITASSGLMYLIGNPGETPLRISLPQAYALGAAEGFAGSMIAHLYREQTGIGQHVDVCIRDAFIKTTISILYEYESTGRIMKRGGAYWALRTKQNRMLWPCKDGHICFRLHGGSFAKGTNKALAEWCISSGCGTKFMEEFDWDNVDMDLVDDEIYAEIEKPLAAFFKTKTREELRKGALERNIVLLPVRSLGEVATEDVQLQHREFWQDVEEPQWGGRTVKYPGAFIKSTETPLKPIEAMSTLGAYNEEVYKNRLGMSDEELALLTASGVI